VPEAPIPDLYELLGVRTTAGTSEIEAAYRRLSKVSHPDKGGTAALQRLITIARDTLVDPVARAAYDRQRETARRDTRQDDNRGDCTVPNVVGMTSREALHLTADAGLQPVASTVALPPGCGLGGVVVAQAHPGGSRLPHGHPVALGVGVESAATALVLKATGVHLRDWASGSMSKAREALKQHLDDATDRRQRVASEIEAAALQRVRRARPSTTERVWTSSAPARVRELKSPDRASWHDRDPLEFAWRQASEATRDALRSHGFGEMFDRGTFHLGRCRGCGTDNISRELPEPALTRTEMALCGSCGAVLGFS
jgi:curved DNA-binding protein CbpA